MIIEKIANNKKGFRRKYRNYLNARSGFKDFLRIVGPWTDEVVLLPAYIGWSINEGSGVFDPVADLGINYEFYRINEQLQIDIAHLKEIFHIKPVKVLVIIHYFGYVDPNYKEAVKIAHEFGAYVLEDEAHSFFTNFIGGASGRLGDASIFSLHKILPTQIGGMLMTNLGHESMLTKIVEPEPEIPSPWEYDFYSIAQKRRENVEILIKLLKSINDFVKPLHSKLPDKIIPQTFPVLINHVSRDKLYEILNKSGIGVVSLYHTLIKQISIKYYPTSYRLSGQILNLPIHQDISEELLNILVEKLYNSIKLLKEEN